jgi:hypothetical protein
MIVVVDRDNEAAENDAPLLPSLLLWSTEKQIEHPVQVTKRTHIALTSKKKH